MRGHLFAAGLLAAASLAMTGCASEDSSPNAAVSAIPTESAPSVPSPSPTAGLDQLPREQALDIRGEYVNHNFTSTCGGEDPVDVALVGGEGEAIRSDEYGSHPVYFQLDRVWRGEIDGLGVIDVAFLICGFGASGSGVDAQVLNSDQELTTLR